MVCQAADKINKFQLYLVERMNLGSMVLNNKIKSQEAATYSKVSFLRSSKASILFMHTHIKLLFLKRKGVSDKGR